MALRHEGPYWRHAQSGWCPLIGTAANVSDITQAQVLLHGDETDVLGDSGYQGVEKWPENLALQISWHVAMRSGKRKLLQGATLSDPLEQIEHA